MKMRVKSMGWVGKVRSLNFWSEEKYFGGGAGGQVEPRNAERWVVENFRPRSTTAARAKLNTVTRESSPVLNKLLPRENLIKLFNERNN